MKKTAILSALILSIFTVKAQTEKNSWLAGGNAGFTSSTQKLSNVSGYSFKTNEFQISPGFGYFFINNFAAGLNVNFISTHTSETNMPGSESNTSTTFTAGPFLRYYFNVAQKTKIFIHGGANWGSYKPGSGDPNLSISMYEVKAGPAIFLNPHVALEFTVGYQTSSYKSEERNTTNSFDIGLGFQIHLGSKK